MPMKESESNKVTLEACVISSAHYVAYKSMRQS